ncbi:restriction endonuclease subunit R [Candidatus Nitrosotenuis cloacae]|uniref:Restriction endonuclease subunit R n=2 Tax=Candidatus Nitrosotenuis cloacae TaxID=1603555 RepID=A0A3G1B3N5_9ARCH|nr:restriction endonuclease subunit R [Candidatus Nitrosotenuis cloacae]
MSEKTTRNRLIDVALRASGWTNIVDFEEDKNYDFTAVREYVTENGPADYVLFHNGRAIAAIEAKKLSLGPQNVLVQAERYSKGFNNGPFDFNGHCLPFVYSTNGEVIWFRDLRRKNSRSYKITKFHTPQAMEEMLAKDVDAYESWLDKNPVNIERLRPYQKEAIESIEDSLATSKRKMLLAMATGTGKTFVASALMYRLLKSGFAKRILFLVDRRALAAQAVGALAAFTPEPGLKFDKIYEVYSQRFRKEDLEEGEKYDPKVLPKEYLENPQPKHTFVYVCTIQRMRINLFGREGMFEWEKGDGDEEEDAEKIDIPIHAFDCIIADECHRGYTSTEEGKWRQVLDHFDAIKVGLTATPAAHTKAYFDDVVYRYTIERAIREGFLVDYDIVRVKSDITMKGFFLKPGEEVKIVDPTSGREALDVLEDEREYNATDLERKATAPDRNKKIVEEFAKHALEFEKEHGRFPKTLFFAINDLPHVSHSDMLVNILRDKFNKGDDFVQKITGSATVDRPLQRIREFRNRPEPAIVVTVDMLTTGVDIPKLENIVFVRPVKSRILFEQMMGRGTRIADEINKTHFTVFDAVGVLDYFKQATDFTADPPEKPTRTIREVVDAIYGNRDRAYNTKSLVRRLQRVAKNVSVEGREMFAQLIPDGDIAAFAEELPIKLDKEWAQTMKILRDGSFLDLMENYPRAKQPFIVAETKEDVAVSEYIFRGTDGTEYKPADYIITFEKFVRKNPDKIEALKILLEKPSQFTTKELSDLRKKLSSRPERFTEDNLRKAYHSELADIITIIRHAAEGDPLMTAEEHVERALVVVTKGKKFTQEQQKWLTLIRDHLIKNLVIEQQDFNTIPFSRYGSWKKADVVFEGKLPKLLTEINTAMVQCRM